MIRPETSADYEAIRQVNRLAFGQDAEARLVDALRDGEYVRASLVAEKDEQVVGQVQGQKRFAETRISVDESRFAGGHPTGPQPVQGLGF
jgi:predicted N-acetyltransferase YhbS